MSEELMCFIALAITTVVGIFTYRKRMHTPTRKQKFIEKAKREGHFTEAVCVDVKLYSGNSFESANSSVRSDLLRVKYKYHVNGVDYFKKYSFQSPGMASIDYPYSIIMYYDSSSPKKCVSSLEESQAEQVQSGCLATIGITLLTLLVSSQIIRFFFE